MNRRSLAVRLLPLALLLVGATAILFGILRRPTPLELNLTDTRAARFLGHFTTPESGDGRTFRWSTPGSRLIFYGAGSGAQILKLTIHGGVRSKAVDKSLRLERDMQPIASFEVTKPEWRVYQVLLPAGATTGPGADAATLDFLSDAYYRELRSLGVPVERIGLTPLDDPSASPLPALLRALLLAWGLLGLAGLLWALDEALLRTTDDRRTTNDERRPENREPRTENRNPQPPTGFSIFNSQFSIRVWRITVLIALAIAALAYAAWRDPYTLAWATPQSWVLALGVIGLTAPLWARSLRWLFADEALDPEMATTAATRRTYAGLFAIALATLMYQNLLSRVFSMTMWYHFAFMAISIAMFGMTVGALL